MNTGPVCFGARDNQYGAFNITKSGRLNTIKLVPKSGAIRCYANYDESYWGCRHPNYGKNGLMTIITNANKESVLPPVEDLKVVSDSILKPHHYHLNGISHTSPELVFSHFSNQSSVSRNQELQIWYGQDCIDCCEENNNGTTCVDV